MQSYAESGNSPQNHQVEQQMEGNENFMYANAPPRHQGYAYNEVYTPPLATVYPYQTHPYCIGNTNTVPQFIAPQYTSYLPPGGCQVSYFPPVIKKSKAKKKAFGCC